VCSRKFAEELGDQALINKHHKPLLRQVLDFVGKALRGEFIGSTDASFMPINLELKLEITRLDLGG
jgi:hypothetical protein